MITERSLVALVERMIVTWAPTARLQQVDVVTPVNDGRISVRVRTVLVPDVDIMLRVKTEIIRLLPASVILEELIFSAVLGSAPAPWLADYKTDRVPGTFAETIFGGGGMVVVDDPWKGPARDDAVDAMAAAFGLSRATQKRPEAEWKIKDGAGIREDYIASIVKALADAQLPPMPQFNFNLGSLPYMPPLPGLLPPDLTAQQQTRPPGDAPLVRVSVRVERRMRKLGHERRVVCGESPVAAGYLIARYYGDPVPSDVVIDARNYAQAKAVAWKVVVEQAVPKPPATIYRGSVPVVRKDR